jgi:hypothetical protein
MLPILLRQALHCRNRRAHVVVEIVRRQWDTSWTYALRANTAKGFQTFVRYST